MNRTRELATTNIRIISIPACSRSRGEGGDRNRIIIIIYRYGALIKLMVSLLQFYQFSLKCNYMRIYWFHFNYVPRPDLRYSENPELGFSASSLLLSFFVEPPEERRRGRLSTRSVPVSFALVNEKDLLLCFLCDDDLW